MTQPRLLIALLGMCLASLSCSRFAASPVSPITPTYTIVKTESAGPGPTSTTAAATSEALIPTATSPNLATATSASDSPAGPSSSATSTTKPIEEPTPGAGQVPAATAPPPTTPPVGPTISNPQIEYFRASPETADPGDTITLEWMTTGAITVTLWKLAPTGQFSAFWDVDGAGTFVYDIGEHERNQSRFALYAGDAQGETNSATLSVALRCPDSWFFSSPPDICPAEAAVVSAGAEQRFENGIMLWVGGEDRIYVLFDDGASPNWTAFPDEWDSGEPDRDPNLNPPPGLFQPVRGFGLVWREGQGVRERIGWATAEESPYPTAVQRPSYAKYNETYIRAADGAIWKLLPERSGWEKIPG